MFTCLGGLENFLLTVDITLLAALVPISLPILLTLAANALTPNVVAVLKINLEVIPFGILSNIPAPIKASIYS